MNEKVYLCTYHKDVNKCNLIALVQGMILPDDSYRHYLLTEKTNKTLFYSSQSFDFVHCTYMIFIRKLSISS